MRRRIFIAINLPEGVRKVLAGFQEKLQDTPARWTKPENLHITLAFLGYVNEEELLFISKTAKGVALENSPFSVKLNKVAYGPPQKMPPRMIWAIGDKSQEFAFLQRNLEKSLSGQKEFFSPNERKEFCPHITLARIRQWDWKRIEPEERPAADYDLNLNFPVDSIEVMESELKKGGAKYAVLESHKLSKI